MIRFLLLLLLLLAFALGGCLPAYAGLTVSPGTPAHTHSDANTGGATLTFSETPTSTVACAAGYTRTAPNYCRKNGGIISVSLTRDVCTLVSIDATAKLVLLDIQAQTKAANVAATARFAGVGAHLTASCVAETAQVGGGFFEVNALAAATMIGYVRAETLVPTDASGNIYLLLSDDAGNQGAAFYYPKGYWN